MSAPNANATTSTPTTSRTGFKMSASMTPHVIQTTGLVFGDLPVDETPVVETPVKPHAKSVKSTKHAAKPVATGGAAAPARETVNLVPSSTGAAAPATESVKLAPAAAPGKVLAKCSVCNKQSSMKQQVVDDRTQRGQPLFCFSCHTAGAGVAAGGGAAAGAHKPPGSVFCKHCALNGITTDTSGTTGGNLCPTHLHSCKAEERQRLALTSDTNEVGFLKSCIADYASGNLSRPDFFVTLCARTEHSEKHATSAELIALFRACVNPTTRLDGVRSGQIITCLEGDLAKR